MKTNALLLIVALLFTVTLAGNASAEIYRWIDESGVTHFSDTPPPDPDIEVKVHEPPRANMDSRPMPEKLPIPEFMKRHVNDDVKPSSNDTDSVELYSTTWCPACKDAKKWLRRNRIRYTDYNVEKDPEANRRYRKLGSGGKIPFAVINGEKIIGFSAARYKRALGME